MCTNVQALKQADTTTLVGLYSSLHFCVYMYLHHCFHILEDIWSHWPCLFRCCHLYCCWPHYILFLLNCLLQICAKEVPSQLFLIGRCGFTCKCVLRCVPFWIKTLRTAKQKIHTTLD